MISEGLSDEGISRALASIGVDVGKSSILRHRTNHAPIDVSNVEIDPAMVVPCNKVTVPPPMGDEPNTLLEAVRTKVDSGISGDITRDRLVRETLLSSLYETQLAITLAALNRFKSGEGRYPLDMVKGLQAIATMFEKTSLQAISSNPSQTTLFDREIQRLETVVYQDAKERILRGERVFKEVPLEYLTPYEPETGKDKDFNFGNSWMSGRRFNTLMQNAWSEGIHDGRKLKKTKVLPDS